MFVPHIRAAMEAGREDIPAQVICRDGSVHDLLLHVKGLTQDERKSCCWRLPDELLRRPEWAGTRSETMEKSK